MAATYKVVTQRTDTVFLGGTNTKDVRTVGYVTVPEDIYFEAQIDEAAYSLEAVDSNGQGFASLVKSLAATPGVAAVQWAQTPTAAGELTTGFYVWVESSSGNSTSQIFLSYKTFAPSVWQPIIASQVEQLDAIEAL